MLVKSTYKGPVFIDSTVKGEGKADGFIPAHCNGSLRVSKDRYITFCATLDTNGWDAVRSIVYQIRSDSPDGQVVKEDLLVSCESGWIPFGEDYPLRKIYGMPMAFGVPKGAKKDGQLLPNQNVFAVKMYIRV